MLSKVCVCKGQCSGSLRQLFGLESLEVLRTEPLSLVISNRVPQPVGTVGAEVSHGCFANILCFICCNTLT